MLSLGSSELLICGNCGLTECLNNSFNGSSDLVQPRESVLVYIIHSHAHCKKTAYAIILTFASLHCFCSWSSSIWKTKLFQNNNFLLPVIGWHRTIRKSCICLHTHYQNIHFFRALKIFGRNVNTVRNVWTIVRFSISHKNWYITEQITKTSVYLMINIILGWMSKRFNTETNMIT